MGLDQYLYGKRYLSIYEEKDIEIIEKLSALLDIKLKYHESDIGFTTETGDGFVAMSPKKIKKVKRIDYNSFYPKEIYFEVMYWRKSNQIHTWFVKNCQEVDDCAKHHVGRDDLQELIDVIDKVLEDHSLAEELLPNQSGFFFGGTDYDEWYFESLGNTKEKLESVLTNEKYNGLQFYYQSSW